MVTGYARMKLYSILDAIESEERGRVLYFDTDSVIFKDNTTKNWHVPTIGDFLGDMTDEVNKDFGSNAKIIRFASGGPKNYGYVIEKDGQLIEKIKVKGITITNEIKDIINFDLIERFGGDFMLNSPQQIHVKQLQFGSEKDHHVYTRYFLNYIELSLIKELY